MKKLLSIGLLALSTLSTPAAKADPPDAPVSPDAQEIHVMSSAQQVQAACDGFSVLKTSIRYNSISGIAKLVASFKNTSPYSISSVRVMVTATSKNGDPVFQEWAVINGGMSVKFGEIGYFSLMVTGITLSDYKHLDELNFKFVSSASEIDQRGIIGDRAPEPVNTTLSLVSAK